MSPTSLTEIENFYILFQKLQLKILCDYIKFYGLDDTRQLHIVQLQLWRFYFSTNVLAEV